MNDDIDYDDVLGEAEPFDDSQPNFPVEVFEEQQERTNRSAYVKNSTYTVARFHVLDHHRETIAMSTRWSSGDHHLPYEYVKGRALGFISGHHYERNEHKRPTIDDDETARAPPAE